MNIDEAELLDGYKEKYTLKCNIDCLYSILIIENSTEHDFAGDLAELEKQNNIFSNYRFEVNEYDFENEIEVSGLKKAFKNTIVSMYIMVSFLRKKVKWLNQYSMTMDDVFNSSELALFFGKKYLKQLRASFVKMLFYWDRVELLLNDNNIALSSRCHTIFSKKTLDEMLDEQYNEKNLLDKILLSINDLNTMIFDGWRIIDGK